MSEDFQPLPPPTPGEHFENVRSRRVRVTEGSKRATKGLKQCNVKVRARTRARFEDMYARAKQASDDELTKGDFFELLLAAYEAKATGVDMLRAAEIMQRDATPPPKDRLAKRNRVLTIFATEPLANALERRSLDKGWTISETIEHACQLAKQAENAR